MSGYAIVMGSCIACERVFSFNPHRVPSIRLTPESAREPVCRNCMSLLNAKRVENGLPPIEIHPDAYNPIPEEEL